VPSGAKLEHERTCAVSGMRGNQCIVNVASLRRSRPTGRVPCGEHKQMFVDALRWEWVQERSLYVAAARRKWTKE
jgi:hypothetical protein